MERLSEETLSIKEFIARINDAVADNNHKDVLTLLSILQKSYPDDPHANFFAGSIYFQLEHFEDAVTSLLQCLNEKPNYKQAQEYFLYSLYLLKEYESSEEIKRNFLYILKKPGSMNSDLIIRVWAQILKNDKFLGSILSKTQGLSYEDFKTWWTGLSSKDLDTITSGILPAGMKISIIPDVQVESFLVKIRRLLLEKAVGKHENPDPYLERLALAMGECCFNNDYLFFESAEEREQLDELVASIKKHRKPDVIQVAILASYAPLIQYPDIAKLLQKRFSSFEGKTLLKPLINQQIKNIEKERQLAAKITRLADIDDSVSQEVRQQYEENPYPRWRLLKAAHKDEYEDNIPSMAKGDAKILIAGCATGEYPINVAASYPRSKVTGIDLSLSSLGYAKRKAREYKIKNLTFIQGDILDLDKQPQSFDVIESLGVIHHMRSPEKGLEALLGVLVPDGYLKLGLYSSTGRRHITACQNKLAEMGYKDNYSDMREARAYILQLDEDHPFRKMEAYNDFYSMSMFRDMLFHRQEHCFTLPEIKSLLTKHNLDFKGFTDLGIQDTALKYAEMFPEDPERTNLDNWDVFEQKYPDTFTGMYKFWVRQSPS